MRKHRYVVACIGLGGLVLLAGCTGGESAPRRPPHTVGPTQSPAEPDGATAPEHLFTGPQPVELDRVESRRTTQVEQEESVIPEPAETTVTHALDATGQNEIVGPDGKTAPSGEADDPQNSRAKESSEPDHRAPGHPDQAPAEPNEPSETIAAEPNEPTTRPGQATALPAFVEGYSRLLRDYVHEDGAVEYGTLHRRRLDVRQLLMRLDELDPNAYAAWPDSEKLAFWINAYNLKMLDIVLRNYPIQSSWWLRLTWPPSDIRHIQGIWTDYKFTVMDEEFTPAEVERRFFHRTFKDPRAYLAITYASRSGPALRRRPYDGRDLDRQLDEQVKAFLTTGQGLQIDRRAMVVHLSALFKPTWRGKEFIARYGTDRKFKDRDPETRAVLSFLTNYLSRNDVYFLETENYTIEYANFDWRLNDTARNP